MNFGRQKNRQDRIPCFACFCTFMTMKDCFYTFAYCFLQSG